MAKLSVEEPNALMRAWVDLIVCRGGNGPEPYCHKYAITTIELPVQNSGRFSVSPKILDRLTS